MKKLLIMTFFLSQTILLLSQTAPQGIPPNPNTADRASSAWYRGGNSGGGANAQNNILWEKEILGNKDRKEFACSLNISYIQRT